MRKHVHRLRRRYRRNVRRLRRSQALFGLLVVVCATVLIVGLPVLLPLAAGLHARDLRRRRGSARAFACGQCGETLGQAALDLADAEWKEYVARLLREHPHVMFRLVRRVHAVCARCGTRYRHEEKSGTFSKLAA